ncbi:hypothetical protein KCP76_05535 [Salmonella enterica subsp. enterica serovar Weltevreden]|nr:hypothetical protein KCP76_05535 [Salmonella enterica subsp. enterica serovar Weltevreden]
MAVADRLSSAQRRSPKAHMLPFFQPLPAPLSANEKHGVIALTIITEYRSRIENPPTSLNNIKTMASDKQRIGQQSDRSAITKLLGCIIQPKRWCTSATLTDRTLAWSARLIKAVSSAI